MSWPTGRRDDRYKMRGKAKMFPSWLSESCDEAEPEKKVEYYGNEICYNERKGTRTAKFVI